MRWVESAPIRPHRCAVIPYIGSSDEEGFIDTGSELDGFDNHVYVSVKAVREMARLLGMPSAMDYREQTARADAAEATNAELAAQVAELEKQLQAIDALESAGFRARKRPGRPTKQKEMV